MMMMLMMMMLMMTVGVLRCGELGLIDELHGEVHTSISVVLAELFENAVGDGCLKHACLVIDGPHTQRKLPGKKGEKICKQKYGLKSYYLEKESRYLILKTNSEICSILPSCGRAGVT